MPNLSAEEGLREALDNLNTLRHVAVRLLERRVDDDAASPQERELVRLYNASLDRMRCERQAIFDNIQLEDSQASGR